MPSMISALRPTLKFVTYIGNDLANTDALNSRQSRRAKSQSVQHGPARRFSNSRRRQGRQFVLLFRIRPRFEDERQLLRIGGLCSAGKQEVQEPDRCRHLHGLIGFHNDNSGIRREIVWRCLGIEWRTERMRTDLLQASKLLCLLVVGFCCLSIKYQEGKSSEAVNTYSIGLFAICFRRHRSPVAVSRSFGRIACFLSFTAKALELPHKARLRAPWGLRNSGIGTPGR
jgi:hypothetical protein